MKSKYIIILLQIILLSSLSSNAQVIGIKGGLNTSKMKAEFDSSPKFNPGIYAGITLELPISESFAFETGLFLASKGVLMHEESRNYEYSARIRMSYLDLPFLIKTTTPISQNTKLYVSFGPYLGAGLGGKVIMEETYAGTTDTEEDDINFGSNEDEDDIQRFELGLTVGSGLRFNRIQVGIYYDLGLSNLNIFEESESIVKNRVMRVSASYFFGI